MGITISRAQAEATLAAILRAEKQGASRDPPSGSTPSSFTIAARSLQITRDTMRNRVRSMAKVHGIVLPPETPREGTTTVSAAHAPFSDRERRDATFWRKLHETEKKRRLDAEHLLDEVSGVMQQRVVPPKWLAASTGKVRRKACVGLLLTDLHVGEVVRSVEVNGLNAYDPDIFRKRVRRYFAAACEIGKRWTADCQGVGALVVLGGDLISGDIHEELRMTNALTSHEQALLAAEELTAGLLRVANAYGRVHVVCVAGNHGRTTLKPSQKQYARLSYDTLTAKMVCGALVTDKRITFDIPNSRDATVPVFGRNIFVTHGDGMGTGGGMGFAGPILPIARGSKKVELQQFRAKRSFDLLLHGHYHHSANQNATLSNGSFPGYTEYGNGLRMSVEPPQQWLFLLHERWWLRERAEIQLDEPAAHAVPASNSPF